MASRRTAATTLEDACAWWRKQVTLKVKKLFVTLKVRVRGVRFRVGGVGCRVEA